MSTQLKHQDEDYQPEQEASPLLGRGARKAPSAFRTISEVADELNVPQHVLRFWETKFTQVKPLKRGGGRRYYRPEDVALLRRIHHLLYTEGYTIKGVQKLMRGQGRQQIIGNDTGAKAPVAEAPVQAQPAAQAAASQPITPREKAVLEVMLHELKELRDMFRGDESAD